MLKNIFLPAITIGSTLLIGCVPQQKVDDRIDINKILNTPDNEVDAALSIPLPAQQDPIWQTSLLTGRALKKAVDAGKVKRGDMFRARISLKYTIVNKSQLPPALNVFKTVLIGDPSTWNDLIAIDISDPMQARYGNYVAQNAFGARTKVEEVKSESYLLAIDAVNTLSTTAIKMGVEGCSVNEGDLDSFLLEYVAKLDESTYRNNKGLIPAEYSSPVDIHVNDYYFKGEIKAARLINSKTGKPYPCKLSFIVRY
ncbi:hypothetical protein [Aeromonas veronii]|uniref:hypothetical protein n=1 Tax=Aeromonas veronii TaxID=654 RepID=UPI003D240385